MRKLILTMLAIIAVVCAAHAYKVIQLTKGGEVVKHYTLDEIDALEVLDVIDAPANVSAAVAGSVVTVSWDAVADAESYSVYRATAADGEYVLVASGLTDTTWSDPMAKEGDNYYQVKACAEDMATLQASGTAVAAVQYEYVDLGLPSGLKWAPYNVGATAPTQAGAYYSWGDVATKDYYYYSTCDTHGLTVEELQEQGYIDASQNLTPEHDAAAVNWGGDWRMPTLEEMTELINNCTWEWTTVDETIGYQITGPNGNCIFMPAAGHYSRDQILDIGTFGLYWTSKCYTPGAESAYRIQFTKTAKLTLGSSRANGHTVRAVK